MDYQVLPLGSYETNCYLCWDAQTMRCAILDPGAQPETVRDAVQRLGLRPAMILLTHGHFDHVGAVRPLAAAWGLPVYLHEADAALPPSITDGPLYYTDTYEEGSTVCLDSLQFSVWHTPGHTPGSVCLQCGDLLFTGDTLFAGACGRTDLPGGDSAKMAASLRRLAALEEDYTVLPGHGGASTLQREQRTNPYLRMLP